MQPPKEVRAYVLGKPIPLPQARGPGGACLEVELEDGCVVQLVVHHDGAVMLRAWGNKPQRVGSATQVSLHATVAPQAATHDDNCNPLKESPDER